MLALMMMVMLCGGLVTECTDSKELRIAPRRTILGRPTKGICVLVVEVSTSEHGVGAGGNAN